MTGQDGAYLAELLLGHGYRVLGLRRGNSAHDLARLEWVGVLDDVELVSGDLGDENCLARLIRDHQPDEVYNLAAQSFVGSSWDSPFATSDTNAMGTLRLLDAVRSYSPHSKFYQASTSELFGEVRETPQNEMTPLNPRSPYGVSKAFGHYMTRNYRESFGLHASSGILFNHESPLRGLSFVTRKISAGLAQYKAGVGGPVSLGNLDAQRDWGYAKEYVEGMWLMLQQPEADDYVLGTGRLASVRDFCSATAQALEIDVDWSGEGITEEGRDRSNGEVVFKVDPRFFRPAEVELLLADPSKAEQQLGWKAQTDYRELAVLMAEADIAAVGRAGTRVDSR